MTEENAGTLLRLAESVATLSERQENDFAHMAKDVAHMATHITTLTTDVNVIRNRLLTWMWAIAILNIASIVGLLFAIIKIMLPLMR